MFRPTIALCVALSLASAASAGVAVFSAAQGSRSASAAFEVSGGNLTVRLTNTSAADVTAPDQVLTGVFFSAANLTAPLTRVSAAVAPGSSVVFVSSSTSNVGGEWAYRSGISGPRGANSGISASGLGIFGPSDRFPGSNVQGPNNVGGLEFGLTSAGDNLNSGNAAVTGGFALIKNSVIFTFSGVPQGFDVHNISKVSFQYGTNLCEPNIIPAPGAGALALAGCLLAARRRRSSN